MSILSRLSVLILVSSLLPLQASLAAPISYEFTTRWISGELAGTTSLGRFTYDSAKVRPNERIEILDLLMDFEFSFREFSFTEATVNTANATFDAAGSLTQVTFGDKCYLQADENGDQTGSCSASSNLRDNFFVQYDALHPQYSAVVGDGEDPFIYPGFSAGETTVRLLEAVAIPEPSSASIFLIGLIILAGLASYHPKRSPRTK